MTKQEQDELNIFIENDRELYTQRTVPIYKNLQKKKGKGIYKTLGAVKLFLYLVNEGAKKYAKEHAKGQEWNVIFSVQDRLAVARDFEKYFSAEYKLGNRWD